MTKLTVKNTHSYFAADEDRPAGVIRSLQEIRDSESVFVWEVAQSGYITQYRLLEKFHAACYDYGERGSSAHFLPAMKISKKFGDRYEVLFLEQAGICPHINKSSLEQSGQFQTFFTLEEAEAYSAYLKTNEDYIESVNRRRSEMDKFMDYEMSDY